MTYAAGGVSKLQYVAVADLNNGTQLDIIIAYYGSNNVGVGLDMETAPFQTR